MIKIGSDFSGVGAFNQALKRLNIPYKEIFACDMDKYARQTFIANHGKPDYYPENVYDREIPKAPLDIYMTSPPCQAFSLAGKRKGENDKRGVLFYNSHEFITKNKPRFFIFENVKGLLSDNKGKTFQNWIDLLARKSVNGNPVMFPHPDSVPYHVYYKVLNAKHYGVPQNRERIFIIGIRDDADNIFRWPKSKPLTKTLKDVLEDNVDEKYYLSDKMLEYFKVHNEKHEKKGTGFTWQPKDKNDTANCLRANSSLCATDNTIKVKSNTKKGYEIATEKNSISQAIINPLKGKTDKGWHFEQCVYNENSITRSLKSSEGSGNKPKVIIAAMRGRKPDNPKSRKKGDNYQQTLEINQNGTSNALSTAQKDNLILHSTLQGGKWDKINESCRRVYDSSGISPTIHTMQGGNTHTKTYHDYKIRRLTPRECFRLMDFPDSFIMPCSDTQMYKQAGNTIVVVLLVEMIRILIGNFKKL